MSLQASYPVGVPSWVAHLGPEPAAARAFYRAVLGWEYHDIAAPGDQSFHVATRHGDPVASTTGPVPEGTWIIAITVDDLDGARRAAVDAGGTAPGDSVDIATLGRFHRLHDPAGAEIHAVQPLSDRGPIRVGEIGTWASSTLVVDDPETVAPFYEAVFGWTTATGPDRRVTVDLPVDHRTGPPQHVTIESADGAPAGWLPGFRVGDVAGAVDVVRAAGGSVTAVPGRPDARVSVTGPDGASFHLLG